MHGYDLQSNTHGPRSVHNGPVPDSLCHQPDSTDSYVTYQDSDDSMTGSP